MHSEAGRYAALFEFLEAARILFSNPTIRAPPPQKPWWTSPVQSWGWYTFCCSLRFWQFVHHPLWNPFFDLKTFVVAVYGWWSPIFKIITRMKLLCSNYFGGLQLQFSGSVELNCITATVSLLFMQNAVTENQEFLRICCDDSYIIEWFSNLKCSDIEKNGMCICKMLWGKLAYIVGFQ